MSSGQHTQTAHAEGAQGVNRLGLVIFIMSEAVLFANLIAAYLYLRFTSDAWAPAHLDLVFPSINTVILLASGVPMHLAHKGIQRGDRNTLVRGLVLTIVLGAIFISGQGWEYLNAGFTPQSGIFGSTFFTLTGFHGAHVIAGLCILAIALVLALRGRFTTENHFLVEAGALYWHFVDVVWVALFAVLYIL